MRERCITKVMETIEPHATLAHPDVIELWLSRQRSPLTQTVYLREVRRLRRSTGRKLPDTSPLDLEWFAEILASSGLAPISQGRMLAAIRSFYRFTEGLGYCLDIEDVDNHRIDGKAVGLCAELNNHQILFKALLRGC